MKWIEVNGVSLRYELSGAGAGERLPQTVVLVHELGGCLDSWDETLPAFQRQFRTLRYDQRGFGQSEKVSGTLKLDDMVADSGHFMHVQTPELFAQMVLPFLLGR